MGVSPTDTDMSVASVARSHLGAIIAHWTPGVPLKSALPRVAQRLGLTARRVRALWHREAAAILHEDMAALERERARIAERILTTEIQQHANQLEGYAARLAMADPDGNREEIGRLRSLARRARNLFDRVGEA